MYNGSSKWKVIVWLYLTASNITKETLIHAKFTVFWLYLHLHVTFHILHYAVPCSNCNTPHKDCIVCQAYHKVYGKDFLSHRFGHTEHHRTTSTPVSEPPRARIQPPDEEPLYQSRAYSAPLPMSRRIFPRETSDSHGSYLSSSTSDEIHERVEKLVQRYSPQPVSN